MPEVVREIRVRQSPEEVWKFLRDPWHLKLMPTVLYAERKRGVFYIQGKEKFPMGGTRTLNYQICMDKKKPPTLARFHTENYLAEVVGIVEIKGRGAKGSLIKFTLECRVPGASISLRRMPSAVLLQQQLVKNIEEYLDEIKIELEECYK